MGLILYLIPVALYVFYKWATANYDYFEKQGIPFRKPLPLLGSDIGFLFKKMPFVDTLMINYNLYANEKLYGQFGFRSPVVTIRDPKIAKLLTVKEFDHFTDHQVFVDEKTDPMFGKLLTSLKGQKWKDMRATLSPAFTGSKMRQMYDFVRDVGQQTVTTMRDDIKNGSENSFEFKALAMRFTVDVIASCAFGIEVNSFKDPENSFYKIAEKITKMNGFKQVMKFFGFSIAPKLMKMMGVELIERDINEFFKEATLETMKVREQKGIVRHDMINLLMEAKKGHLSHTNNNEEKIVDGFATVEESQLGKSEVKRVWDDEDLAAQCLLFFLAGFDTVSTTMGFMAYELVCNPDIQQKLYDEIAELNDELDGKKITYEQIQGLKYLDQTISETLRKWPIAGLIERTCVKDYDLKFDGKTLHFDKGVSFFVPIHCFHNDPKYFANPDKFDPERFSNENRGNIDTDTYLPFGIGPRNCIGSRFALMELKTIFYFLLLNFSFEVTEKTQIPFQYEKVPFALKSEKGIWVGLNPRD